MYYILAKHIALVGFLKLPYAVRNLKMSNTEFLTRERFMILYRCDGKHDIDPDLLSEDEGAFFSHQLKNGFVIPCEADTHLEPYQEYRFYNNRYKDTAHWSITGRCNYRCKHCFMSAPDARFGHPTLKQCLELICQMEMCGIASVSITGGEPLVRDDFPEIVEALTQHHIRIASILTNGALVNNQLLDMLEENHQHPSFQMSYDGAGWHDWMRGVDGAEKRVLEAFTLLRERGYNTSSAMALHKGNAAVLRDSVQKLSSVGCSALKVNIAYPSGEWLKHPEYFMSREEGFLAYLGYIPQYFADGAPLSIMLEGFFAYNTGEDSWYMPSERREKLEPRLTPVCSSLRSMVYISPEGTVLPCQAMISAPIIARYPNAFDVPLKEILTDSVYIQDVCSNVSHYLDSNPECAHCEYAAKCCGGCRAMGVGADGTDFFSPDMKVCDFYKKGWYERFKRAGDMAFESFKKSGGLEVSLEERGEHIEAELPPC